MKDDLIYLGHIQDSIKAIKSFTKGMDRASFKKNRLVQDAVIRNLEIIGEASKKLSNNFRKKFKDVPWKAMAGMRDVLIHGYFGVDLDNVWNVVAVRLSALQRQINKIIRQEKSKRK